MFEKEAEQAKLYELMGARINPEREAHILKALEHVCLELAKLRELDLKDVHPAVVYKAPGFSDGGKDDL